MFARRCYSNCCCWSWLLGLDRQGQLARVETRERLLHSLRVSVSDILPMYVCVHCPHRHPHPRPSTLFPFFLLRCKPDRPSGIHGCRICHLPSAVDTLHRVQYTCAHIHTYILTCLCTVNPRIHVGGSVPVDDPITLASTRLSMAPPPIQYLIRCPRPPRSSPVSCQDETPRTTVPSLLPTCLGLDRARPKRVGK